MTQSARDEMADIRRRLRAASRQTDGRMARNAYKAIVRLDTRSI